MENQSIEMFNDTVNVWFHYMKTNENESENRCIYDCEIYVYWK